MFNPLVVGLIVFALVLAGAFAGWVIKQHLPKHHLTEETKNAVSVSMAVVATISALVLGLLISNANTKFSVLEGEVTMLSAEILRLDQILRRYGPDTNVARETVRQYAEQKTADLFPRDATDVRLGNPSTYELLQHLEDLLLALRPAASLMLCALAVAGAVGMFLELEQGFGRLVHISPQPMRHAVNILQTQLSSIEP